MTAITFHLTLFTQLAWDWDWARCSFPFSWPILGCTLLASLVIVSPSSVFADTTRGRRLIVDTWTGLTRLLNWLSRSHLLVADEQECSLIRVEELPSEVGGRGQDCPASGVPANNGPNSMCRDVRGQTLRDLLLDHDVQDK